MVGTFMYAKQMVLYIKPGNYFQHNAVNICAQI